MRLSNDETTITIGSDNRDFGRRESQAADDLLLAAPDGIERIQRSSCTANKASIVLGSWTRCIGAEFC